MRLSKKLISVCFVCDWKPDRRIRGKKRGVKVFKKILIANRGEIACRVMRTAQKLSVKTVAVYSEADSDALHVRMADEAIYIGPAPVLESYLVIESIINAALRTKVDAIHPGYGFLSENAHFAEACRDAGIVFIGPSPDAIKAMGEKSMAKDIMERSGVPVVPGYHGVDQSNEALIEAADRIGYPVLIKAAAGGGGRGMREVRSADKFLSALRGSRREALAAFGNEKVLIEKFLTVSRHIEIQIFGDGTDVIHLFERDCSVQRRHQKIIEESPAPGITTELRERMGAAAVAAAKAIQYTGAGTVEFIVDVTEGIERGDFYFMEMNTRLQVEHPVTEMVTGHDLVEWQMLVALGRPLPVKQEALSMKGHAVEVRLYAENPFNRFFPSSGKLTHYRPPLESQNLRVDNGVSANGEITIYYDPMFAKVIAWANDRSEALSYLIHGLENFEIDGVENNIEFLSAILTHPAFIDGQVSTDFIERFKSDVLTQVGCLPELVPAVACLGVLLSRQATCDVSDPFSPWAKIDSWRLNEYAEEEVKFRDSNGEYTITATYGNSNTFSLRLPTKTIIANGVLGDNGHLNVSINGRKTKATFVREGQRIAIFISGKKYALELINQMETTEIDFEEVSGIQSPLPGKVVKVIVADGNTVKKGQPLMVVEAMKMEHTIFAPKDGIVDRVVFSEGDQVEEGVELVILGLDK